MKRRYFAFNLSDFYVFFRNVYSRERPRSFNDSCNEEDSTCTIEDDIDLLLRAVRKNHLALRQFHHIGFLKRNRRESEK